MCGFRPPSADDAGLKAPTGRTGRRSLSCAAKFRLRRVLRPRGAPLTVRRVSWLFVRRPPCPSEPAEVDEGRNDGYCKRNQGSACHP